MFYEINYKPEEIIQYLRKSRADDPAFTTEEVLAKHETILAEWVERNIGAPIPSENIYREIVSGETIDDRPEMLKVLKRIENPKIKAVLVVEVQRLSRGDLEDAGRLIKLLRYTNTAVITLQKTYQMEDEYDRDIFERELKRGNEYLEYQKRIMDRGRTLSAKQGNYIGSDAPYGYNRTFVTDGKKKYPTLDINKEEATVVKMIFDMYVNQDMGCTLIANELNRLGIRPRKAIRWTRETILGILTNIHYIGKVRWKWRKTINIVDNGDVIKTRKNSTEGNYIIADGKHPAIIASEAFSAAQEKRKRRANTPTRPNVKVRNPFAGLIYCECGRAMTLQMYIRKGKKTCSPRLMCSNQTICNNGSCLFTDILDAVKDILQQTIQDFEIKLKNEDNTAAALQARFINQLENKIAELEKKEILQWEKYTDGTMPEKVFEILNNKVRVDIEATKKSLKNARASMPEKHFYEEKIKRFTDALDALNNPDLDAAKKNKLLKACIERITYSRQRPKTITGVFHENGQGRAYTSPEINLDVKLYL